MAENVAKVEAGHGNLRYHHLEERGESREDTELVRVEAKPSRGTKVTTLHDAGRDEDFRVLLVDHFQTSRTLQVTLALYEISIPGYHWRHSLSITMTFSAASSLDNLSSTRLTASPKITRFAPTSFVDPMYR